MAIDISTFRSRYPEITEAKASDPTVQIHLTDAECDFKRTNLSSSSCGENIYERFIFALAAHETQIGINRAQGSTVGGGAIASKSVGKVSVSYASRTPSGGFNDDYYNQTIYGQQFLSLLYRYCVGFLTIC
jgi:uncharacterized membrane protein